MRLAVSFLVTKPSDGPPPLVSLARVVIEDAKKLRGRGRRLQAWVLGIGIFAVLAQAVPTLMDATQAPTWLVPASKKLAYVCAMIGLVLQGVRWWCQRAANDKHSLGNTIKRRAMLIDSLGPSSERLDIRLLRELAGADAEIRAHVYPLANDYYASVKPPGMERLRENLQESAFFSHRLYDKAANAAFFKFGVTVACIVVALLIVASLAPRDIGTVVANCILAFVSFLVSADQLGHAMNWKSAAATVERIERRLDAIVPNGAEPYMAAFADYEAATAATPAIPTALYEKERKRLDALWRDKRNQ